MCLAVPGKIIEIFDGEAPDRSGRVSFGGIVKGINLSFVPEARVDDYVIAHAGVAISILDAEEAEEVFRMLSAMESPE